jgi:hypothetical protein
MATIIELADVTPNMKVVLTNKNDVFLEKSPTSGSLDLGPRVKPTEVVSVLSGAEYISNALYRLQIMFEGTPTWVRMPGQRVELR